LGLTGFKQLLAEERSVREPDEQLLRRDLDVFVLVAVRFYRDGIADALRRDPRFQLVGSAASLEDAEQSLRSLARPPDVTLVDVELPWGAAVARVLRAGWPSVGIVVLAVREADEVILSWAEAGVSGIVSRDATLDELLDAVDAAGRAEVLTSPAVTAVLLRRVASLAGTRTGGEPPALTRREREVVRLIGRGLSNKEIAAELRLELPTVKNHVHNVLEKLRVAHRADAAAAALARGELDRI
jgi:two-component system, NarL family, nitrate/nitrite response regulator NarL